jgi:anti-sigma factor RsiW
MMSTPCPDQTELALLVDGELTENRARAVRGHLSRCACCREEARAFEGLVGDLSVNATEGLDLDAMEAAILARLDSPADGAAVVPARKRRSLVVGLAAAAAIAAVGLVVLLSIFSVSPEPEGQIAAPVSTRQPDPAPSPLPSMQSRMDDLTFSSQAPPGQKARPVNASVRELLFEQPGSEPAAECVCRHPAVFRQSL